jgi:hypothetical protein
VELSLGKFKKLCEEQDAELSRLRQQVEGLRGLLLESYHYKGRGDEQWTEYWTDAEIDAALTRQAQQPPPTEGAKQ